MRKWNVAELDAIEHDIALMSAVIRDDFAVSLRNPSSLLDSEPDCAWLAERIGIREQHGTHVIERCDGCPDETKIPTVAIVTDYHDEMGAPSNLGISYLCRYHVRNDY